MLDLFSFTFVIFGVAVLVTAAQLFRHRNEDPDVEDNLIVGVARRFLPMSSSYDQGRMLSRGPQTTRVRIARELVRQITAGTTRVRDLEAEVNVLVESYAPQLLEERGCGPLTAAKLIGEIAGAERFATDAKLARTGAAAPNSRLLGQHPVRRARPRPVGA